MPDNITPQSIIVATTDPAIENAFGSDLQDIPPLTNNAQVFIQTTTINRVYNTITGGGQASGSPGQVQFNQDGQLAADNELTYNPVENILSLVGVNASYVLTDNLLHANGVPYTFNTGNGMVAGTTGQLQFANGNNFGATQSVTYGVVGEDKLRINSLSNLVIPGGSLNQVIVTDGLGNLSFANSNPVAAGSTNDIQFNVGGALQGSSNLRYYSSNTTLSTINVTTTGVISGNLEGNVLGNVSAANLGAAFVTTDLIPFANATRFLGNVTRVWAGANIDIVNADTVITKNLTTTENVILGNVSNISISGGAANQFLQTDGTGILTWAAAVTRPVGANTQIQFNNNDSFGASPNLLYNNTTSTLTIGNLTSNVLVSRGNIISTGLISAEGNISGGNLISDGIVTATGNVSGANITTSGKVVATGDITGANVNAASNLNVTGTAAITGNASVGNISTGIITASGNITSANLNTGIIVATGNATVLNLSTANVTATGNAAITGNVTANNANIINDLNVGDAIVANTITANIRVATANLSANGANVSIGAIGNLHITGGSANAATAIATISAGNITSVVATAGGDGYDIAPTISFTPVSGGSGAVATAIMRGQVGTITIVNPGLGYSNSNVIITIQGTNTSIATATATVDSTGAIQYIRLTNPGAGYFNQSYVSNTLCTVSIGGSNTSIASATLTIVNSSFVAGNIINAGSGYLAAPVVTISQPTAKFLKTDGAGNLSFSEVSGGGGSSGGAAGTYSSIQYNDAGELDGISSFTFDKTSNVLTLSSPLTTSGNVGISGNLNFTGANASFSNVSNLKILGGSNGQYLKTDGAGNVSFANVVLSSISNGNSSVSVASSANVTITANGNSVTFSPNSMNVSTALNVTGNVLLQGSNVTLGLINNLKISNSSNAQGKFIQAADAIGGLQFATAVTGAADGNFAIQYNVNGNFAGDSANLSYANNRLIANNATVSNVIVSTGLTVTGSANLGSVTDLIITGGATYPAVVANVTESGGAVIGVVFANAGLGYDIAPKITIVGPNTGTANVYGVINPADGSLSGVTIITAGTGYSNANISGTVTAPGMKYLSTNGTGDLSWQEAAGGGSSGGGGTNAGGSTTQVQFNSGGTLSGVAGFTYITGTNTLNVPNTVAAGNLTASANLTVTGRANANIFNGNYANLGNANVSTQFNLTGNLTANGANIDLGNISNLHISGGSNNQFLKTDGTGNIYWSNANLSILSNGTSNVSIATSGGNITAAVGGTAVAVISATLANLLANASVGANLTVGANANVTGNLNVTGNANVTGSISGDQLTLSNTTAAIVANVGTGTFATIATNYTITKGASSLTISANGGTSDQVNIIGGNSLLSVGGAGTGVITANAAAVNFNSGGISLLGISATQAATTVTSGVIRANGGIGVTGNAYIGGNANIALDANIAGNANIAGRITVQGNANFTGADISLGNVANLHITGGSNLQYLRTDGAGNVTWANAEVSLIANGNSFVSIPTANGSVVMNVGGVSIGSITNTGFNLVSNVVLANANLYVNGSGQIFSNGNITSNLTSSAYDLYASNSVTSNANIFTLNRGNIYSDGNIIANTNFQANGNAVILGTANVTGNINASENLFVTTNANISGSLNVTTNANVTGNARITGNLTVNTHFVASNTANVIGTLNVPGNVNFSGPNVTLGNIDNLHIDGGNTDYFLKTDGAGNLSWAQPSVAKIANGTSNINIPTADGTISFAPAGNAIATMSSTTFTVSGNTSLTGNLTSSATANFSGNINSTGNVAFSGTNVNLGNVANLTIAGGGNDRFLRTDGAGNLTFANVRNLIAGTSTVSVANSGAITVTSAGNNIASFTATALNITGNIELTGDHIEASGNIQTANAIIGGSLLANLDIVAGNSIFANVNYSGNANILIAGNVSANGFAQFGGNIGTTANLNVGADILGSGNVGVTANISAGGNLNANVNVVATGNVTGGNITTAGVVAATGNVSGGNITTAGVVSATGNVTGGNLITGGNVTAKGSNTQVQYNNSGNLAGSSAFTFDGTNVATTGNIAATGNVAGGNLTTAGVVTATGNVSGGNVTTAGLVSATGNVTGGNITTAGVVSATGNITGGNITTAGLVSATGNVSGANLIASANLSVSGIANITGNITGSASANISANLRVGTSIGVGTAASGNAGEIVATGNIIAFFSDDRLKTRLGNIENALDKVDSIATFYFHPNDVAQGLGYANSVAIGVSAQDTQAVVPEIVADAPIGNGYLTVQYDKFAPLVLAAIKELRSEINEIKKRLQ